MRIPRISAKHLKGRDRLKKHASNLCRDCGRAFRGQTGSYRCPNCKKKEARYKEQREKMRRRLPFYLKTEN
ncbi:MAG: hypothetical protein O7D34_07685 [Ignavibacteria bacterium]|nr:hypothetical protein [Ignavibacteria bacterium]